MNSLITLKAKLESFLTVSSENKSFIDALEDGLYSTNLCTTALEQWLAIWTQTDSHCLTETEIYYQEGVQFVADTWEEIKNNIGS